MRLVKLSLAGVDAELPEQRFHAERARFIGMMGTTRLPIFGCFNSRVSTRTSAMVLETRGRRTFQRFLQVIERWRLNLPRRNGAARQVAASSRRRSCM